MGRRNSRYRNSLRSPVPFSRASSDVAVASRSTIEDSVERRPVKKRVNFPKTVDTSIPTAGANEECSRGRKECPAKERINAAAVEDISGNRDGNPSDSTGIRSSKAGQGISPRFPSSSRVVHGIQDGGPCHERRRRGRDWFGHGARCVCRISNRTTAADQPVSRGRCVFSRKVRDRRDNERRLVLRRRRRRPRKQLLRRRRGAAREKSSPAAEEPSEVPSGRRKVDGSSSSGQTSRKRRVGIVENRYVIEGDGGGSSAVCELVRDLERLFGERENNNVVAMRSKKQQGVEEEGAVDPIEANETYDEFDTIRMPVVRSLSKSPQSDEGIEADPERRRGSVARCWSLDSAAASDEDASLTTHQFKRHKLRVTRCCSSDSAVLSDEDQIKGEGDAISADH